MRNALKYGAGLIGIYLAVVYFDGTSSTLGSLSGGASNIIAAFQGRAANVGTKVP